MDEPVKTDSYELDLGSFKIHVNLRIYRGERTQPLSQYDYTYIPIYEYNMRVDYDNSSFIGSGSSETEALQNLSEKIKLYKQLN